MNLSYQARLDYLKQRLDQPDLTPKQRRNLNKKLNRLEKQAHQTARQRVVKLATGGLLVVFGLGFVMGIKYLTNSRPKYPPVTLAGHIEAYPPNRFSTKPIPEAIHKHILEHTPQGTPGVVITYNCTDFDCDPQLPDKLRSLLDKYPHLYVAAGDYDSPLIISRAGRQIRLEGYNEEAIIKFINSS